MRTDRGANHRPRLFVTFSIDAERQDRLAADFDLTFDRADRAEVRAILVDGDFRVDKALLDAYPSLRLICCIGTGYNAIDLTACASRGVSVTNTAGANADAVADVAIGLILSVTRRMAEGERLLRANLWRGDNPNRFFSSPGLTGRRVGLFGMGMIGQKTVHRLAGFDVEIAYGGPRRKPDIPYSYHADLGQLAAWADILVLAHRADETNRGLVNREVLEALGPQGYLINVARGLAVDEDALIAALQSGALGGAGLDVFDNEPHVRPELLSCPNTVLTPHIAGGSRQSFDRMFEVATDNLHAFFAGGRPVTPVLDMTGIQAGLTPG